MFKEVTRRWHGQLPNHRMRPIDKKVLGVDLIDIADLLEVRAQELGEIVERLVEHELLMFD